MKTRLARPTARLRQGRNDWYRFDNLAGDSAAAPGTATLHLYDEIGYWGITAQDLVTDLAQVTAGVLEVHLNSPGGDVFDGIAIKNALEQHPATVNITVDGIAASIASVIAMAGDTITMAPGSEMMIHEASGLCIGNAGDMQEMVQLLDFQSANIAAVYAGRAGGDAGDWRTAMKAETWYTAEEAVAAGLADKVLPGKQRATTAPDQAAVPDNSWDLTIFNYAGRDNAPAPKITVRPQSKEFSDEFIESLCNLVRARNAADTAPAEAEPAVTPAEPADDPTTVEPAATEVESSTVEPAEAAADPAAAAIDPPAVVPEVEPADAEPVEPINPAPAPVDAWAATVAHLTAPRPDPWAAATAHLTTGAQRGDQHTKETQ